MAEPSGAARGVASSTAAANVAGPSLLALLEVAQIGRGLRLLGRHQVAVRAQHVGLGADLDVIVVLAAIVVAPERPLLVGLAPVGLADGPGPGQSMVEH